MSSSPRAATASSGRPWVTSSWPSRSPTLGEKIREMRTPVRLTWRVAVLALVLLVPGLVARAANDGTITGVVTDERGEPVAGATVSFVANGQPRTTTTDRNGRFVVET